MNKDSKPDFVLINSLYFKGSWKDKFSKSNTHPDNFYYVNGDTHTVDFMQRQSEYQIWGNDVYTGLRIPFSGGYFSMYVFLPDPGKTPYDVIDDIITEGLTSPDKWDAQLVSRTVDLQIPKFGIEKRMELRDVLQSLGIKRIFSSEEAELYNIASIGHVHVTDVIQSNSFTINEEGGEAATVTSTDLIASCLPTDPSKIVYFTANRPFIFALAEQSTNTILFMGQINKL